MPESSEKSIFLAALEKSEEERDTFLSDACAGDSRLRAEIDELLEAHQRSDNLLDAVPVDVGIVRESLGRADLTSDFAPMVESPGTVIGPYKLMEQIGEGGFGLVFVAEQQQPVRRKVALKVVKPGMDTRDVIARFEAERQALALMDHPNIARVFDAGSTGTGRPYFVMELVRGIQITDFCDQQRLDTRQRLKLFVTVCHAVQHAHQKGVIHRDLKPSNVLVTLHDGTPVAKVIDFGIAKAIGQSLTDKTIYTRFAAMIGTPLYMSPEQAEMSGLDVDTRSDIYSLGVLLYGLLTGSTPFNSERLQNAGLDELRRIICDEEPPRPSARLTTLGQASISVSANRSIEPRKLTSVVKGDLDWIVMKAIEKDRSRRYETAIALAADVQRYLSEEPIEARPPSRLYRVRKYARRHKVTISTVAFVITAMIFGTGISIWQAARAMDEGKKKEIALADAVKARQEADEARKQVQGFAERLKEANVLLTSGRAHADASRWSAANLDYTRATELQPRYYNVWVERGSLYVRLGLWKLAAADFAKAFELGAPTKGPSWWGVPPLLWFTGYEQQCREVCGQILGDSDATTDQLSWSEIRSCLLAAVPATDCVALAEQAEKLLEELQSAPHLPPFGDGPPLPRGFGPPNGKRRPPGFGPSNGRGAPFDKPPNGRRSRMSWLPRGASLYVTGWAQFRAGQFDRAIELLEQSNDADGGWPSRGIGYPLLAMAYQRSGRGIAAREALAAAERTIGQWNKEMADRPVGTMPRPWFDWIECAVLFREANILITGFAPPDDPRLRAIEQKAQNSLQERGTTLAP
jgi:eukaryotic-like serine/threonine-protein kinase